MTASVDYIELRELAENGDCVAQNTLGVKLATSGDYSHQRDALYWYLEAVENGYVESIWNAATMLINGEGGIESPEFGLHLVELAANAGHSGACLYLANCCQYGLDGFNKSLDLSRRWQEAAWDIENESDFVDPVNVDEYLNERPEKPK